MPEHKILITDKLHEAGLDILHSEAQVENCAGISGDDLLGIVAQFDAMIVRSRTKVNQAVFKAGERLKVVGRAGVGVDNIDLAAATDRQVTVVNAPVSSTLAVAEQTLGLMLSLARSIPRADAAMKSGRWIKKEVKGVELHGKTLGIIGVGRIGSAVAERAVALGMTVLGYDTGKPAQVLSKRGAHPTSLDDLYARSDFISIHVPFSPDTRGMIDGQALAKMKRGVRLICTARGGIVDETALLGALESGQAAGAALDVFATEPPGLTALVAHPNVVATPHSSAQTHEAQIRAACDIAEEVLAALQGEQLRWKVV